MNNIDLVYVLMAMALGALGNIVSGLDKGNRYVPTVIFGGITAIVFNPITGFAVGLAYLVWRSTGWYKSIDMGRNEGIFIIDFMILTAIAVIPTAILGYFIFSNHDYTAAYVIASLLMAPISYTIAMWAVPWKPGYKHIMIGEGLTGAGYGALISLSTQSIDIQTVATNTLMGA